MKLHALALAALLLPGLSARAENPGTHILPAYIGPNAEAQKIAAGQLQPKCATDALHNLDVLLSIDETALYLSQWNKDAALRIARQTLRLRVCALGVRKGLVEPVLVLSDLAVLANHKSDAVALVPTVARLYPGVGAKLADSLGLPSSALPNVRSLMPAIRGLDTAAIMKQAGLDRDDGFGRGLGIDLQRDLDSAGLGKVGKHFRGLDPSGLADIMLGEGSMIRRSFEDEKFNPSSMTGNEKSPMYGMTRDDVASCFSSCGGTIDRGGRAGQKAGTAVGGAIGAALGGAATWESGPGAVGGIGLGLTLGKEYGPGIGKAVGEGLAGAACVASCAGDGPKTSDGEPSTNEPGTTPAEEGSQPPPKTQEPPAPKEQETPPPNKEETPPPKTSDGDGNGKQCNGKPCEDAMPARDDDGNGGGQTDDTGLGGAHHPHREQSLYVPNYTANKIPYVNPVRDIDRMTIPKTGFERGRFTNGLRGGLK